MSIRRVIAMSVFAAIVLGAAGFVWRMPQRTHEVVVAIPADLTRMAVADVLGEHLDWDDKTKQDFASVYSQMHWASFNEAAAAALTEQFNWGDHEREVFLTSSTLYFVPEMDFLSTVYEPGEYIFMSDSTIPTIAALFVMRAEAAAQENPQQFVAERIHPNATEAVAAYVQSELELLPDLSPSPAGDLTLDESTGPLLLKFSTTYYNHGDGPLELRADPATQGIGGDLERTVFQRIYAIDGTYRDRKAGVFLWHEPHVHYHFADFIVYTLEPIDVDGNVPDLSNIQQKSTFCIRDISRIDRELEHRSSDGAYRLCGQERQGISVGWGDTYFFTYPDQALNISNVPSGRYKLTFIVNPEDRFEELSKDNNISSVTFDLDVEQKTVTVVETAPSHSPELEHIYVEQSL